MDGRMPGLLTKRDNAPEGDRFLPSSGNDDYSRLRYGALTTTRGAMRNAICYCRRRRYKVGGMLLGLLITCAALLQYIDRDTYLDIRVEPHRILLEPA